MQRTVLAALLLGVALAAGCAHAPPAAPVRERIEPPATPPDTTAPSADSAISSTSLPAPVLMPREWQNHNGEDYDDLFDRLRAGFVFDEVQEPAIDEQLGWLERNPDYLERVFQRAQRYMYHIVTEVESRGMPLEFALLPVVESAYEPFAYSSGRAAGLWQFIPGTGVRFGLKRRTGGTTDGATSSNPRARPWIICRPCTINSTATGCSPSRPTMSAR